MRAFTQAIEVYISFLQGKGGGGGDWNHRAEVTTALKMTQNRINPVVFDIGANNGSWTSEFKMLCPGAVIYCFEPNIDCQRRVESLKLDSVTIVSAAVGGTCGTVPFFISDQASNISSIHERHDTNWNHLTYREELVPVTTIDAFLGQHMIEFIDFVKMDIEGHEFEALKGAQETLRARKIGAMSFEFGSGNINSRIFFRDFWEFFREFKCVIYRITPGGMLPIKRYYEDLEYFRGTCNYIVKLND